MPDRRKAVVLWESDGPNKATFSTVPICDVPEEDCFEGSITRVRLAGKSYAARVLKISSDPKVLDKAEDDASRIIDEKECDAVKGRGKRFSMPKKMFGAAASEREVSAAAMEKQPRRSKLTEAKKMVSKTNKAASKLHQKAQTKADEQLLAVTRNLFKGNPPQKIPDHTKPGTDSEGTSENDILESQVVRERDEDSGSEQDISAQKQNPQDEEMHTVPLHNNTLCENCSCRRCTFWKTYGTQGNATFLEAIAATIKNEVVEDKYQMSDINDNDMKYLDVKSLTSSEMQQKYCLSPGSGVFISAATKSRILLEGSDNPKGMIRTALMEMFPVGLLPKLRAKGGGGAEYALRKDVLDALYNFIKRHTDKEHRLKWAVFTDTINRKCEQLGRNPTIKPSKERTTTAKTAVSRKVNQVSAKTADSPSKYSSPKNRWPKQMNVSTPVKLSGNNRQLGKCTTSYPVSVPPTATNPTPATTNPTPPATDTTPPATDTTPPATDTTPPATDTTPAATDTTPATTNPTPATTNPTPAATYPTPAATYPTPAATDSTPESYPTPNLFHTGPPPMYSQPYAPYYHHQQYYSGPATYEYGNYTAPTNYEYMNL